MSLDALDETMLLAPDFMSSEGGLQFDHVLDGSTTTSGTPDNATHFGSSGTSHDFGPPLRPYLISRAPNNTEKAFCRMNNFQEPMPCASGLPAAKTLSLSNLLDLSPSDGVAGGYLEEQKQFAPMNVRRGSSPAIDVNLPSLGAPVSPLSPLSGFDKSYGGDGLFHVPVKRESGEEVQGSENGVFEMGEVKKLGAKNAKGSVVRGRTGRRAGGTRGRRSIRHSYEDEIDPELPPEEAKRMRRMLSNRESARRSRRRKQAHLQQLESQVSQLQGEQQQLLDHLERATEKFKSAADEKRVLKMQVAQLSEKVMSLTAALKAETMRRNSRDATELPLAELLADDFCNEMKPDDLDFGMPNDLAVLDPMYDGLEQSSSAFCGKRARLPSMQRISSLEHLEKKMRG